MSDTYFFKSKLLEIVNQVFNEIDWISFFSDLQLWLKIKCKKPVLEKLVEN